jgi:hypothetical protein
MKKTLYDLVLVSRYAVLGSAEIKEETPIQSFKSMEELRAFVADNTQIDIPHNISFDKLNGIVKNHLSVQGGNVTYEIVPR